MLERYKVFNPTFYIRDLPCTRKRKPLRDLVSFLIHYFIMGWAVFLRSLSLIPYPTSISLWFLFLVPFANGLLSLSVIYSISSPLPMVEYLKVLISRVPCRVLALGSASPSGTFLFLLAPSISYPSSLFPSPFTLSTSPLYSPLYLSYLPLSA